MLNVAILPKGRILAAPANYDRKCAAEEGSNTAEGILHGI